MSCEGAGAPGVCRRPGSYCSAGTSCPLLPSSVQTVWPRQQVMIMIMILPHHSPHLTLSLTSLATSASTARRDPPTGATWQPGGPTASRWAPGATLATPLRPGPSTKPGTDELCFTVWRTTPGTGKYFQTASPGSAYNIESLQAAHL